MIRAPLAVGMAVLLAQAPAIEWRAQSSGVTARLRGVSAVSSTVAWASGANATLLRTTDGGQRWERLPAPAGADTLDFRDIDAVSDRVAFALSIGPGESSRIYKTGDGGAHWDLQFANTDPKVFLDAMAFWDADRGVAFSDSVDGRFVILTTANGGKTWERVAADRVPAALPGEGAYAASGTNVAVSGRDHVWIGTTASRVLRSADGGRTWAVAGTPVATGNATGIFSIAFRDARRGVVVGGNYSQESLAHDNAAYTSDGGATWTLVTDRGLSGFRSVVSWAGPRSLIAIGPAGADWSADEGRSWTPVTPHATDGRPAGFDAFSLSPDGRIGWATGQGGRISRLSFGDAPIQVPDFKVEVWGDALVDFNARMEGYAELRRALERGLKGLEVTDRPIEILRAETALAERIRKARPRARQGHIFTEDISKAFREALRAVTNPENCAAIRGDGPERVEYRTHRTYPKDQALSTMPPGVLGVLPVLPPDVDYRFVRRHLILHDTRANVILDRIPNAISCGA